MAKSYLVHVTRKQVNIFSHMSNRVFVKLNSTCSLYCRETIFSQLASELFPSIRPSVEYLAEEVPVPIPSADSE